MVHYPWVSRLICVIASVVIYTVLVCSSYRTALCQWGKSFYQRLFIFSQIERLCRPIVHFSINIYSILSAPRSASACVPFSRKGQRLTYLYWNISGCGITITSRSRTGYEQILSIIELQCRQLVITVSISAVYAVCISLWKWAVCSYFITAVTVYIFSDPLLCRNTEICEVSALYCLIIFWFNVAYVNRTVVCRLSVVNIQIVHIIRSSDNIDCSCLSSAYINCGIIIRNC